MKKAYIFLIIFFVGIVGGGFFFRGEIFTSLIEWRLQSHCVKVFGAPMRYESLQYCDDGALYFSGVTFYDAAPYDEGGYSCAADALEIHCSLEVMKFRLSTMVAIHRPTISVIKGEGPIPPFPFDNDSLSSFSGVSFLSSVVVSSFSATGGSVIFQDVDGSVAPAPVSFSCSEASFPDPYARLSLSFDGVDDDGDDGIVVVAERCDSDIKATATVSRASCSHLSDIAAFLYDDDIAFSADDGVIDGSISIVIPRRLCPYLEGELIVSDLSGTETSYDLVGTATKVSATFSGDRRPRKNNFYEENSFIGSLLSTTSCTLSCPEGINFSPSSYRNIPWSIADLKGSVTFASGGAFHFYSEGSLVEMETSAPFVLHGHLSSSRNFSPFLAADIIVSPAGDPPCAVRCRGIADADKEHTLSLSLENVGPYEFAIVQHFLNTPLFDDDIIALEHGTFDASLSLSFVDNVPTDISIDSFSLNSAVISSSYRHSKAYIGTMSGSLTADVSSTDPISTVNAAVDLSETSLAMTYREERFSFEDITSSFSIADGIVDDSSLSGTFAGITGDITFDFSSSEAIASCVASCSGSDVADLFPSPMRETFGKCFADDAITLEATLSHSDVGIFGDGIVTVTNDDTTDMISIGFDSSSGSLQRGWFHSDGILLEKYVAPFIFGGKGMSLSGTADVEGTLVRDVITLQYSANDVVIENRHFSVAVDAIGAAAAPKATHHFSLKDGTHFGYLPVDKGLYRERHSGLVFDDIDTVVHFDSNTIAMERLDAVSNGVALSGRIFIDFASKGSFTTDIFISDVLCQLNDFKRFCSHFTDVATIDIPLSGTISSTDLESSLIIKSSPDDVSLDANVYGALSSGVLDGEKRNIALEGLSSTFAYHHATKTLSFHETEGTIFAGNDTVGIDKYRLYSPEVTVSAGHGNFFTFDAALYSGDDEFSRFAGKASRDDDEDITWSLDDDLCHIGGIIPHIAIMKTSPSYGIKAFNSTPSCTLTSLVVDLQRLSRAGIVPLHNDILELYKDGYSAGILDGSFYHDENDGSYFFGVEGGPVILNDDQIKTISLSGRKKHGSWLIKELSFDDFSMSASIHPSIDTWNIDFFTITNGDALSINLTGEYNVAANIFKAHINNFDADIDGPILDALAEPLHHLDPHGTLHASGGVQLHVIPNEKLWHITSNLDISFDDITFAAMPSAPSPFDGIALALKELSYSIDSHMVSLEDLSFTIPAEQLSPLSSFIAHACSLGDDDPLPAILTTIKDKGSVEGSIGFIATPSRSSWNVCLKHDTYHLFGKNHALRNFFLEYYDEKFSMTTQYRHRDHTFWVSGNVASDAPDNGVIIFSDGDPRTLQNKGILPLTVSWKRDDNGEYTLDKAEGTFSGVRIYAVPAESSSTDILAIKSKVHLNTNEAQWLLPRNFQRHIEAFGIRDGYELVGTWNIDKKSNVPLSFSGSLCGKNFAAMGYIFDRFSSQCEYSPGNLTIKDLRGEDLAGTITIPSISFDNDVKTGKYSFSMPSLLVTDFKPSLLYSSELGRPSGNKNFIISSLTFDDVNGIVGDTKSFSGDGRATFSNSKKSSSSKSLLSIPSDIISRIGLDTSLMTPSSGSIYYTIEDSKVVFTKLDDVYSEGKASRFLLSTGDDDTSYVDFSGNLYAKIKMKQYNILFKLAELFTITIKGSLIHPSYTFQKQTISESEED